MTRVDFYTEADDKLKVACRLTAKAYTAGKQIVVYAPRDDMRSTFDRMLWTFQQLSFVPHVGAGHPLAAETPVILAAGDADVPHHDVLINLDSAAPPFFARFDRLLEIVSNEADDKAAGRERWRFYKDRGYPLNAIKMSELAA